MAGTNWKAGLLISRTARLGNWPRKLRECISPRHSRRQLRRHLCSPSAHCSSSLGLFTRINAILLFGALSGAILQNLLAGRDPQLAILYTLVVLTLAFMGGGRISLR